MKPLLNPLSVQDPHMWISCDCSTKVKTAQACYIVFQFDVVCNNHMCQHGFQLACSEETSRAIVKISIQQSLD